jgi:hypothetical protein
MKRSELKALILECKQELAEEQGQKEITIDEVEKDYEALRMIADKYRAPHVIKGFNEGVDNSIIDGIVNAAEDLFAFVEEYEEE